MQQPHTRKARLRNLGGADGVIGTRGLPPTLRVEASVALAEANEVRLHAVGDPEVEMSAMRELEEAGGAKVLVVGLAVDIGPEFPGAGRDIRLADEIFA